MNIHNEAYRDTILDWLMEHSSVEMFSQATIIFSKYEQLEQEFGEDENKDRYNACLALIERELNKILLYSGKHFIRGNMICVQNNTIH